uniref:Uncharacterized protein n=1 Tax=Marseillevirus LCMAC102 TaxID=2506603 RepID=A0A481YUM9_9VIRU|nr:MAG: hypothetical protein LCMAC102_02800 [Marseillevirus LCMAC102]
MYPDLAYKNGSYVDKDTIISKSILGVIKNVSSKLQEETSLPRKFLNYPKYLQSLSEKTTKHRTVQDFSKTLGEVIERPKSRLTIEYNEKVTTHVDENITITEKEKETKSDGTVIERERITLIGKRTTTETEKHCRTIYENYLNETAEIIDKDLQTSENPLFRCCHDLVSKLMALRGLTSPDQIPRKSILGALSYKIKDCETEWFSYSKVSNILNCIETLYSPMRWKYILLNSNVDFDNPHLEQFSILYEKELSECTPKEKKYIDLRMACCLISLVENTNVYDIGTLIEFKEECQHNVGECMIKD